MAASMALHVQLIGTNAEMEGRASRIVRNLGLLLTPVPMEIASESALCGEAREDVIALRPYLENADAILMNFFNVFEPYVLNYDCVVRYSDELPVGQ